MTRKDYVRFAAMLKNVGIIIDTFDPDLLAPETVLEMVRERTANIFAADNDRFDRSRFLKACRVES